MLIFYVQSLICFLFQDTLNFIPAAVVLVVGHESHLCALAACSDATPVLPRLAICVPAVLEAAGVPVHTVLHHAQAGCLAAHLHTGTPTKTTIHASLAPAEESCILVLSPDLASLALTK